MINARHLCHSLFSYAPALQLLKQLLLWYAFRKKVLKYVSKFFINVG